MPPHQYYSILLYSCLVLLSPLTLHLHNSIPNNIGYIACYSIVYACVCLDKKSILKIRKKPGEVLIYLLCFLRCDTHRLQTKNVMRMETFNVAKRIFFFFLFFILEKHTKIVCYRSLNESILVHFFFIIKNNRWRDGRVGGEKIYLKIKL